METKKNKSLDLENKRLSFIGIGLLFSSSLLLASFSYTDVLDNHDTVINKRGGMSINYLVESKVEPPKNLEQPKIQYTPPVDEKIKEKENEKKIITPVVIVSPPDIIDNDTTITIISEEVIDFPDKEAMFPGGTIEMVKWVSQNINYPQVSIEFNEKGRVYLSFVVEPDGKITNIKIERGVSVDLDREAKRVLMGMPNWVPGEKSGKKVRTRCSLPINFEIN